MSFLAYLLPFYPCFFCSSHIVLLHVLQTHPAIFPKDIHTLSLQSSVPDNCMVSFPMSLGKLLKSETIPTTSQLQHPTASPRPLNHGTSILLITHWRSIELITPWHVTYLFILHIVCPTHSPHGGLGLTTFKKVFIGVYLLYNTMLVSFYCTAKWISYSYTYIPSFFGFPSYFYHHKVPCAMQ